MRNQKFLLRFEIPWPSRNQEQCSQFSSGILKWILREQYGIVLPELYIQHRPRFQSSAPPRFVEEPPAAFDDFVPEYVGRLLISAETNKRVETVADRDSPAGRVIRSFRLEHHSCQTQFEFWEFPFENAKEQKRRRGGLGAQDGKVFVEFTSSSPETPKNVFTVDEHERCSSCYERRASDNILNGGCESVSWRALERYLFSDAEVRGKPLIHPGKWRE